MAAFSFARWYALAFAASSSIIARAASYDESEFADGGGDLYSGGTTPEAAVPAEATVSWPASGGRLSAATERLVHIASTASMTGVNKCCS